MGDEVLEKRIARKDVGLPVPSLPELLQPFRSIPTELEYHEFCELLKRIFEDEARRLNLSPERYEYTSINLHYYPENPALETHYLILDPVSPISRGIIGNLFGPEVKSKLGVDLGHTLELTKFEFEEVLFRLPGIDVGGYGNLHSFLDTLNTNLTQHNLIVAYVRHQDVSDAIDEAHTDYLALIKGVPLLGAGLIKAGNVDLEPIRKIGKRLYYIEIKGGKLISAPIAATGWSLLLVSHTSDLSKLDQEDIPLKSRDEDTLHHLNGTTPHYFRRRLEKAYARITDYLKPMK